MSDLTLYNPIDALVHRVFYWIVEAIMPIIAFDPFTFCVIATGLIAVTVVLLWGRVGLFAFIVTFNLTSAPSGFAYDRDQYQYRGAREVPRHDYYRRTKDEFIEIKPTIREKVNLFVSEAYEGGIKGDVIPNPSWQNLIGQFVVSFSPAAPVADFRDVVANSIKSYNAGFKEHKKDVVFAVAGFVPTVKETYQLTKKYETFRSLSKSIHEGYVVSKLPALTKYADAFQGPVVATTLRKGDVIYRTPFNPGELTKEPGRWFGANAVQTRNASNVFYNQEQFGNANEVLRKYIVKRDITVYSGQVKGGIGFQYYIPDNIKLKEVIQWQGSRRLP